MTKEATYYCVIISSTSAFSIGAADSIETDSDIVLDSKGYPLLPASSIRGACRGWFRKKYGNKTTNWLFGSIENGNDDSGNDSLLRFYDATYLNGNKAVCVRDNVKLRQDEKIAEKGLKFDRQVAEPGTTFETYIELPFIADKSSFRRGASNDDVKDAKKIPNAPSDFVEEMIGAIQLGKIRFGAKTSRGLGVMVIKECKRRHFDLDNLADRNKWLEKNMFEDAWWIESKDICSDLPKPKSLGVTIKLKLNISGAISIREYSTEPDCPDYYQLSIRYKDEKNCGPQDLKSKLYDNDEKAPKKGKPLIPGTSWAGAFRSRYRELATAFGKKLSSGDSLNFVEELFGAVRKNSQGQEIVKCSRIVFSESVVEGGEWKNITRNAIDRFTGGTIQGALFTEGTHYGGTTDLQIEINDLSRGVLRSHLRLLLYVIADLHYGFMAVGGLTSVGHGRFEVRPGSTISFGDNIQKLDFPELDKQPNIGKKVEGWIEELFSNIVEADEKKERDSNELL